MFVSDSAANGGRAPNGAPHVMPAADRPSSSRSFEEGSCMPDGLLHVALDSGRLYPVCSQFAEDFRLRDHVICAYDEWLSLIVWSGLTGADGMEGFASLLTKRHGVRLRFLAPPHTSSSIWAWLCYTASVSGPLLLTGHDGGFSIAPQGFACTLRIVAGAVSWLRDFWRQGERRPVSMQLKAGD